MTPKVKVSDLENMKFVAVDGSLRRKSGSFFVDGTVFFGRPIREL